MMSLELAVQPPAEFPSSQTREPPRLWLAGPGGEQLSLPGTLWPAAAAHQSDPIMFAPLTRDEANRLLIAWDHPLGEYRRPFGYQAWGMAVDGRPVAVAVSGSTVSATIRTEVNGEPARVYARKEVVELARIARSHEDPRILRVMLRLWTDYLACRWPYWSVTSAVSYAVPGKTGDIYKFDGWKPAGVRPASGGGGWSRPSRAGRGRKRLFVYSYER